LTFVSLQLQQDKCQTAVTFADRMSLSRLGSFTQSFTQPFFGEKSPPGKTPFLSMVPKTPIDNNTKHTPKRVTQNNTKTPKTHQNHPNTPQNPTHHHTKTHTPKTQPQPTKPNKHNKPQPQNTTKPPQHVPVARLSKWLYDR